MNRVEKIWQELSAQPQEVELAKVDDIKAMASKLDSLQNEVNKLRNDALEKDEQSYFANKKMVQSIDEYEKLSKLLTKEVGNLGREIKDMGINPNQVPALSDALQPLADAEVLIDLVRFEGNKRTFTT
jgi:TolA-binding protein